MGFLAEIRKRGDLDGYRELMERMPYAELLGISVESIDPRDRLVLRLRFDSNVVGNPNLPAVHGGVIGAFLEMTAIFQLVHDGEGDALPKPINLTIDYLRSAGSRDTFAHATITKRGRRVGNVRVEAWQDDPERPIAAALGHFLMPQPA